MRACVCVHTQPRARAQISSSAALLRSVHSPLHPEPRPTRLGPSTPLFPSHLKEHKHFSAGATPRPLLQSTAWGGAGWGGSAGRGWGMEK